MLTRDLYFDTLKFVLIILVIFGHVIEPYRTESKLLLTLHSFIYTFHMPLFILVSGYFSKNLTFDKLKKGTLKLLETYIVFQLIFAVLGMIMAKTIYFSWLYIPHFALWYIFSLIIWRIVFFVMKDRLKPKYIIILSILASIAVGFLPFIGYPLSASKTIVFFPFFVIGVYLTKENIEKIKSIPNIFSILFLSILLIACYFLSTEDTLKTLAGSRSYNLINNNELIACFARCTFILVALITSIAIMNMVKPIEQLAKLGLQTTNYYIYHMFFLPPLAKAVTLFNIPTNIFTLLAYSLFIIISITIFNKFRISDILLNPISYLGNRSRN